jgi:hypothetical protein
MADDEVPPPLTPGTDRSESLPQSAGEVVVERFMGMMSGNFPAQDQFLDKLDTTQLGKLIDQGEAADKRAHQRLLESNRVAGRNTLVLIITIPVSILGLAWIFLYYGNAAELSEIIALLLGAGIGGAGGYGFGLQKGRKPTES